MPKVRVLRPHAYTVGVGIYKVGEVYDEQPYAAQEKVTSGFVEYVDHVRTKESREVYDRISVRAEPEPVAEPELRVVARTGGWYIFSDSTKVLGKKAAAEKLGVSIEEIDNVDLDDD